MSILVLIGGGLGAALVGYLFFALLFPEKLS